jgi:hypothetical protein
MSFKMNLQRMLSVLEPIAQAVKCLESTQSTLVDVFIFWQAVLGRFSEVFTGSRSGFSNTEQTRIRRAVIHHYNETINDAPTDTYLLVFFLDPCECVLLHILSFNLPFNAYTGFRNAPVYKVLNPLSTTIRVRKSTTDGSGSASSRGNDEAETTSSLPPFVFQRILSQALNMLKQDMLLTQKNKKHPLARYDAQAARDDLEEQIHQYRVTEHPFHRPLGRRESTIA